VIGDAAALAALVRASAADAVLVRVAPDAPPLALAQMRASLGPLAVERAPAQRVNALLVEPGADPADAAAAETWLAGAASTTGQWLVVSARR
jgi:hypothetical protein